MESLAVAEVKRRTAPQPLSAIEIDDAQLRMDTVCAVTGLSPATIYRKVRTGEFPAPVRRGSRCSRWPARAVREWLAGETAGGVA
jgi:prophage regulatory protein